MPSFIQTNEKTLNLKYNEPYDFGKILRFLAGRAIPGVESVSENEYLRTVRIENEKKNVLYGYVRISQLPDESALSLAVSHGLSEFLPEISAKARHLFDLSCNPQEIYKTLSSMNEIRSGLCVLGARLPGCFDSFEMAVRAVLGQQITVKAATTLTGRLVSAFGSAFETGIEGLEYIFPTTADILALEGPIESHLGPLGIISARAKTIYALAEALEKGEINLTPKAEPQEEMKKLLAIRGIGNWTAQYIAMRAMGYGDAFLETDAGVKKAMEPYNGKELLQMAENWRPWRSYATINIWNSLN